MIKSKSVKILDHVVNVFKSLSKKVCLQNTSPISSAKFRPDSRY